MKYYLAPLEGVTNYLYRNAYAEHFSKIDKYFTPFITTSKSLIFTTKELKEILPEHNAGLNVVPQILSNKSDDFIKTAKAIQEYGYNEINLNLGCPSGTVVAKNKGSGFLFHREALDLFLDEIYSKSTMKISIKTRLGKYDPEEFYELIKIFNKYPIEELIIHPRVQKDMYKNRTQLDIFEKTFKEIKCPVCYNGDIFNVNDYNTITSRFPSVDHVMLGRGIIANPSLVGQIKKESIPDKVSFRNFHDSLYNAYKSVSQGDHQVLYKMKEIWFYMINTFSENKKYAKKIRRCDNLCDYDMIINALFLEQNIDVNSQGYRNITDEFYRI